jgi:UV DNA damage endonuclease
VHISGREGPEGIRRALSRLSTEARNCITIENDEMTWGIDSSIELAKDCALVLDIHHHWINSGEYIEASDDRVKRIIDSWRGVRPVIHYSLSREDVVIGHATDTFPALDALINQGYKKQKLRAHSNFYWNTAVNEWALSFRDSFDIMCESKAKNLASFALYEQSLKQLA